MLVGNQRLFDSPGDRKVPFCRLCDSHVLQCAISSPPTLLLLACTGSYRITSPLCLFSVPVFLSHIPMLPFLLPRGLCEK